MTVKYLKLLWYQIFVHQNLKLLDFLSDFVLIPQQYNNICSQLLGKAPALCMTLQVSGICFNYSFALNITPLSTVDKREWL